MQLKVKVMIVSRDQMLCILRIYDIMHCTCEENKILKDEDKDGYDPVQTRSPLYQKKTLGLFLLEATMYFIFAAYPLLVFVWMWKEETQRTSFKID